MSIFSSIAIVLATFIGPIAAVQVQKYIEKSREIKERKLAIYKTLMATRNELIFSLEQVRALNLIKIEFYKEKAVIDAWETYHSHLSKTFTEDSESHWGITRVNLYIKLLYCIGENLGYHFNEAEIENAYRPLAHDKYLKQQKSIFDNLERLFNGEIILPIKVVEKPKSCDTTLLPPYSPKS